MATPGSSIVGGCFRPQSPLDNEFATNTILHEAKKKKADLIVLGTHGRRGIRRILLGSDAETVLRESRVPVLLVRATEPAKRSHRARPAKAASGEPVPTPKRRQTAHTRA
jgi:hypothetical protein